MNYLGKPTHPYELCMRVYVKDPTKRQLASEASSAFFRLHGKQYSDVYMEEKDDNSNNFSKRLNEIKGGH